MKLYAILTLLIMIIAIRAAYIMRGGFFIGGEWFIPMLVYLIHLVHKVIKEDIRRKEGRHEP